MAGFPRRSDLSPSCCISARRLSASTRGKTPENREEGGAMRGLMMEGPLLIQTMLDHAAQYHGDTEIVSRTNEGPIHRYTYTEAERRSKRLAKALRRLG